jgi:peroxiredoxin
VKVDPHVVTAAQVFFIGVAAYGVFGFVSAAQRDQSRSNCSALCALAPAYAGRNRIAPDFELKDMKGNPVRLSQYRGKTVVLNFWTRTCRPCLEEMPSIVKLAQIAKGRSDFVVVTVSTDAGPDEVKDILTEAVGGEAPFPVLFDSEQEVVTDKYGTKLFPETWIIDPRGVVRARFDGTRDWTSPVMLDLIQMVARPGGCPVEFEGGKPGGPRMSLCGDG